MCPALDASRGQLRNRSVFAEKMLERLVVSVDHKSSAIKVLMKTFNSEYN